jgi:hypothetical protein
MPTITVREELHNHVRKIRDIAQDLKTAEAPKVREQAVLIDDELTRMINIFERKPEEGLLDQKIEQPDPNQKESAREPVKEPVSQGRETVFNDGGKKK